MRIDFHTHTLRVKDGDEETRQMPDNDESYQKFIKSRIEKNIGIVALTNHNFFDIKQYNELVSRNEQILFLPGVELDVIDKEGKPHHCNLIVNPDKAQELVRHLPTLEVAKSKERLGEITTKILLDLANKLDGILLIENRSKGKKFPEEDEIISYCEKNNLIYFFEAVDLEAAKIMISHGIKALTGSDSDKWDDLNEKKLFDIPLITVGKQKLSYSDLKMYLRFHINDLYLSMSLSKDDYPKVLEILPMDNDNVKWHLSEKLDFPISPGITIISGPKGSGKSAILNGVRNYLCDNQKKSEVKYYSPSNKKQSSVSYESILEKKKAKLEIDNNKLEDHLQQLMQALEESKKNSMSQIQENLSEIFKYHNWKNRNKNFKFSRFQEFNYGNDASWNSSKWLDIKQKINEKTRDVKQIRKTIELLQSYKKTWKNNFDLGRKDFEYSMFEEAIKSLEIVVEKIISMTKKLHRSYSVKRIAASNIENLQYWVRLKKKQEGQDKRLGLFEYWSVNKSLEEKCNNVLSQEIIKSNVVTLGEILDSNEKNQKVTISKISYVFMSKEATSLGLKYAIDKPRKTPAGIRETMENIIAIKDNYLDDNNPERVDNLISWLRNKNNWNLLNCSKIILKIDGEENGDLSSGQKQFIAMFEFLSGNEYKYYLLDEPELSLDNKIVTEFVIKKLEELKQQNKIIIVVTHNPNIAINTRPIAKIYRSSDGDERETFVSFNPFSTMTSTKNDSVKMDWKNIALNMLEGGKSAFEGRANFYEK